MLRAPENRNILSAFGSSGLSESMRSQYNLTIVEEARPGGPTWRWIAEQLLQLTTRMYSVQFSLSGETEPEADHQTHACSGFSL